MLRVRLESQQVLSNKEEIVALDKIEMGDG